MQYIAINIFVIFILVNLTLEINILTFLNATVFSKIYYLFLWSEGYSNALQIQESQNHTQVV